MPCVCDPKPITSLNFCPICDKVHAGVGLGHVRLAGFVGVQHSNNDSIDQFLRSGDPNVLVPPHKRHKNA